VLCATPRHTSCGGPPPQALYRTLFINKDPSMRSISMWPLPTTIRGWQAPMQPRKIPQSSSMQRAASRDNSSLDRSRLGGGLLCGSGLLGFLLGFPPLPLGAP